MTATEETPIQTHEDLTATLMELLQRRLVIERLDPETGKMRFCLPDAAAGEGTSC